MLIYSFLDLMQLINKIAKLSCKDRDVLLTSRLLDQPRVLKLRLDGTLVNNLMQFDYCVRLSTSLDIHVEKMTGHSQYNFDFLLLCHKEKLKQS